jgi:hypothetical protein
MLSPLARLSMKPVVRPNMKIKAPRLLTLLVVGLVSGCVSHTSTPSDIRSARYQDFKLSLSDQTDDNTFHLLLKNVSCDIVLHNYLSPSFFVWVIHDGKVPLRLFLPGMNIDVFPPPVMEPGEIQSFEIPFNDLEFSLFLADEKVNLSNSCVFVEYMMAGKDIYSNSIRVQQNYKVGTDRFPDKINKIDQVEDEKTTEIR